MGKLEMLWQWRVLAPVTGLSLLALAVVPLYVDGARHQAVAQGSIGTNKVIINADDGEAARLLRDQGMAPFARYDGYSIWMVTPAQAKQLSGLAGVRDGRALDTVTTPGGDIRTRELAVELPEPLRAASGAEYQLRLVQFGGPIKPEWQNSVLATGVQVAGEFPQNALLVWASGEQARYLDELSRTTAYVQWSSAYAPFYRLDQTLIPAALSGSEERVDAAVRLFVNPGTASSVSLIRTLSEAAPDDVVATGSLLVIQARLRPADLAAVASLPDVVAITPVAGATR